MPRIQVCELFKIKEVAQAVGGGSKAVQGGGDGSAAAPTEVDSLATPGLAQIKEREHMLFSAIPGSGNCVILNEMR